MKNFLNHLTHSLIDSRDILARISDLESLSVLDEFEEEELKLLTHLKDDCSDYTSEFESGTTLIAEDYFEKYCKDSTFEDGYLPKDSLIEIFIDWGRWIEFVAQDYKKVSCGGQKYLVRSS
jgi:hypothetical protein